MAEFPTALPTGLEGDETTVPYDEPHEIVRELAERGPFINDGVECQTCDMALDIDARDISRALWPDPANHEPSCLWRRARVLYPPT